ncbi:CLUMA_CG009571, isoform A [Clunio marinus]|uniref:CLUMA_CG009571, isoform A n=1 Tax=Clunio marinus TaxID=568069 RepID=A0A1J1I788_9DIPT|nr:CLUMA_CG009571, isoform A [Clunio marinus]
MVFEEKHKSLLLMTIVTLSLTASRLSIIQHALTQLQILASRFLSPPPHRKLHTKQIHAEIDTKREKKYCFQTKPNVFTPFRNCFIHLKKKKPAQVVINSRDKKSKKMRDRETNYAFPDLMFFTDMLLAHSEILKIFHSDDFFFT